MLGLDGLAHFVPREDADAVRAIKGAGALVFGKNNLVEMSYGLTGHNARYGQVKNPLARDRVSGGSSSGSAASVAANIVPASLGGDTVGSIPGARIALWRGGIQAYDWAMAAQWRRADLAYPRHNGRVRPQR